MEYLCQGKEVKKQIPLVSVSITAYQHINFIEQAIESVLSQKTNFPFELLVGEDESSDGTRELCIQYADRYPDKIRLFLRSREDVIYIDGSASGRFNFIENIKAARGKYIALLDGDDFWTDPLKLQKQVDFLENNDDYVISFHDAKIVDVDSQTMHPNKLNEYLRRDRSVHENVSCLLIPTLSAVFRTHLIETIPKEFYEVKNGDSFLFAIVGQHGKSKFHSDICPAAYRKHFGGIWSKLNSHERTLHLYHTYRSIYQVIADPSIKKLLKRKLFKFSIQSSKYVKGILHKVLRYVSSYKYASFTKQDFLIFKREHRFILRKIKRIFNK